jgi:hypothetical protein
LYGGFFVDRYYLTTCRSVDLGVGCEASCFFGCIAVRQHGAFRAWAFIFACGVFLQATLSFLGAMTILLLIFFCVLLFLLYRSKRFVVFTRYGRGSVCFVYGLAALFVFWSAPAAPADGAGLPPHAVQPGRSKLENVIAIWRAY